MKIRTELNLTQTYMKELVNRIACTDDSARIDLLISELNTAYDLGKRAAVAELPNECNISEGVAP